MIPDLQRLNRFKALWCLAFALGFLATQPLWMDGRAFPLTGVVVLPSLPPQLDRLRYAGLFLLLAAIAFSRRPLPWLLTFLAMIGYLAIGDQSRWHPWFYWYGFMALALAVAYGRESAQGHALNACRVILLASYVWSGLQKINITFYHNLFPWLLGDVLSRWQALRELAYAVPVIEISVGVFLCLPTYRRAGVILGMAMHLLILLALGPLGHDVNRHVWPWNLSLLLMLPILFWNTDSVGVRQLLVPSSFIHAAIALLFLFLPSLTFLDLWDTYPGFSFYAGSQRTAYMQFKSRMPPGLPAETSAIIDEENRLLFSKWALHELGTPDYPEPRIYKRLGAYLCRQIREPGDAQLVILSKPDRGTGERTVESTLNCGALR